MAEAVLFNVVQSLLNNLGSVAVDEIAATWGFKTNLEKLKNSINTIKDVLLDAEERQFESHAVRGWLDRLKSAVYAADDLFDEFATMASQREAMTRNRLSKKVLTFFSHSNQVAFAFNISKKIKEIREDLDDIVKDSSEFAFVLRPREEGSLSRQLRDQTHSFVDVEEVVGREGDREAIIDILMASSAAQGQRLSVIPIVGIGGLGKTTLAQLLYNDERVERHFELKLWVCVSEVFDVKEVIKKILMSATNTQCQNLEMDQLQALLRKEIGGKKYLLVLDDVWNEKPEEWLNLSAILKFAGGEGSKILVTTRSMVVAGIMGTVPAYELEGLSDDKSWALFEKMAFEPGEAQEKPHLVKLGKKIVKKCAHLPLALKTLGSLLYRNNEEKWVSVADTSFAELPDNQNIMAVLKLSYNHLLSPLKNCFAYCALFPKDYEFEMETLIDLWMAEGFIVQAIETQILKELGDEYVKFLLQRCFFQDITRNKWGDISGFKMHDLMHDLALEVAGTESKMAKLHDRNFSDKIHHLSFGYHLTNLWEIPACMLKAKQLRTFLLPEKFRDGSDFNRAVLQQLISNFRCLRVLDLRNLGVRSLPNSIGESIHLRYLNLSMNPIEELPHSITKLHNLQTLILYNCYMLKVLPTHIRKLTNLRSLNVLGCDSLTHMPPGLGELTSLHKLSCLIIKSRISRKSMHNSATAKLRDLKTLNNLRGALKLIFYEDLEDSASDAREANLSSKHGLTELVVGWYGVRSLDDVSGGYDDEAILEGLKPYQNLKKLEIRSYKGEKLPSWAMTYNLCTTLPILAEIRLYNCRRCRQVPSFSQLPYLRCLSLVGLVSVEYMEKSPSGLKSPPLSSTETFFPSLLELELKRMDNLKGWWEETKAIDSNDQEEISLSFSTLTKLQIKYCKSLASFPLCPNVEELVLTEVNRQLNVLKTWTSSAVSGDVGSSVTISEFNSKLKTLSIDEVVDLISLREECLGRITSLEIQDTKLLNTTELEEVFKSLSSLRCLRFDSCYSLTSVSEALQHLTTLDTLAILNCQNLDLSQNERIEDGMPWKALNSLCTLHFENICKLVHLPVGLQHLTNLRYLKLSYNRELEELPRWISSFPSLQFIDLYSCPKLARLPEEFRNLTALHKLEVGNCPGLTVRLRAPFGENVNKTEHVPQVYVSGSIIVPIWYLA